MDKAILGQLSLIPWAAVGIVALYALKLVLDFLLKAGYLKRNGSADNDSSEKLLEVAVATKDLAEMIFQDVTMLKLWHSPDSSGVQEWKHPGLRQALEKIEQNTAEISKYMHALSRMTREARKRRRNSETA